MPESTKVKNCKQAPSCKVKEDGKCLESLELNVCPHFYFEDSEPQIDSVSINQNTISRISLFSGEELYLKDLPLVTNKYRTRTVMIIGDSKAGKSTLLTSVFDHFQLGYFKDFLFAGSVTQVGFEKRCHPSRVESGAEDPQTERTKLLDFNFLHLGILRSDSVGKDVTHLLLSDISGETFKQARDSSERMKQLSLVKAMDFIVIMLDGRRLADLKTREASLISMKTFIYKAIEEGIFTSSTKLKIVVSKWDLLHKATTFQLEKNVVEYFDSEFKDKVKGIDYHKIVARTKYADGEIKSGYGLSSLLEEWTSSNHREVSNKNPVPVSGRMFNNFRSL